MASRRKLLLAAVAAAAVLVPAAAAGKDSSSSQVAFTGCLGLCVANSGCGTSNTHCVCSAATTTEFLDKVVVCIARYCLLSNGRTSDDTDTDAAVAAIDHAFLDIVATVCANDGLDVPASKISEAHATASSVVSEVLHPAMTYTTKTVYRSTQTTQGRTTTTMNTAKSMATAAETDKTSSKTSKTTADTTGPDTSDATSQAATASDGGVDTITVTATADTASGKTKATSTTKSDSTSTKQAPSVNTTDSSPFTNANAATRMLAPPSVLFAAAAAVLPMALSVGMRLLC